MTRRADEQLLARVAMVVINDFTSDARVDREAASLATAGYAVTVYALHRAGLPTTSETSGYRLVRIPLVTGRWPKWRIIQGLKYLEFFCRSVLRLTKGRFAIVHCHDLQALPIGYVAARLTKAKLVYDAHELETGRVGRLLPWSRLLTRWIEGPLARRASAIVTVCERIAATLRDGYGVDQPVVVRNGALRESQAPPLPPAELRRFCTAQNILVYEGILAPGRGLESVLSSLAYVQTPSTVLMILGDGKLKKDLQCRAERMGLDSRVCFLGHVPPSKLRAYTRMAKLGIHAIQDTCLNNYYCLPNKLFEYLMAGIPVVVSDFPEMRRVVQQYDVGELVDPEDPRDIARGIDRVLLNPERYAQLRANVQAALGDLCWETESQILLHLYSTLVGSPGSVGV